MTRARRSGGCALSWSGCRPRSRRSRRRRSPCPPRRRRAGPRSRRRRIRRGRGGGSGEQRPRRQRHRRDRRPWYDAPRRGPMAPLDRAEAERQLGDSLALLERFVGGARAAADHPAVASRTDRWGVAMNLAHLAVYEERVAAPVLEALADGGDGRGAVASAGEGWLNRE